MHPPAHAYLELDRKELEAVATSGPATSPRPAGTRARMGGRITDNTPPLIRVAIDLLNDRAELQGGMHRPRLPGTFWCLSPGPHSDPLFIIYFFLLFHFIAYVGSVKL